MRIDNGRDILLLGDVLPYEDGAESRILQALEEVGDRSSTSDELAARIIDWPTRYHFSRLRRNLLAPFRFEGRPHILEIGCGTGSNLIALAESGAEVVGVEGSVARARAARVRTLEHDMVTVYAGDAALLTPSRPFDFVLLIGVLEYSTSAAGGAGGPIDMLELARSFLKPDGVLVLAIENQVGLKYLLSHPEDHLGLPWIGLDGYPETTLPRTWSRAVLASLLTEAGFESQEWMYPFPDYKLPTFIAHDRIFRSSEGRQVVSQFIRQPVQGHAGSARLVCDSRRAFEVVLDAELGPDTANSFLVAASATPGAATRVLHDADAWISSGERLQRFRSQRTISRTDDGYELGTEDGPTAASPAENSWLRNVGHRSEMIQVGDCMEDLVVAAARADDMDELATVLRLFDGFLASNRVPSRQSTSHPFFVDGSRNNLPADFLDCTLKNVIVDAGGGIHFVDREWVAVGDVDEEMIRTRAYFEVARRIATSGIRNRWSPMMTVGDLVRTLHQFNGDSLPDGALQRFAAAEEEIQRLVSGAPPAVTAEVQAALETRLHDAIPTFSTLTLIRGLQDLEQVRAEHHQLQTDHKALTSAFDELQQRTEALQHEFETLGEEYHALERDRKAVDDDRQSIDSELTSARGRCRELESALSMLESAYSAAQSVCRDREVELESLRNSRSYRVGRALGSPLRFRRRQG